VAFAPKQIRAAIVAAFLVPAIAGVAKAQALPDAKSLMEKHNTAVGGRAALDKHTSMKMTGKMEIVGAGITADVEVFRAKPSKILQRITIAQMGEVLAGYDGATAWGVDPGVPPQIVPGEAPESAQAHASNNSAVVTLWARGQVRELEDQYAVGDGSRPELERRIVEASLRYSVLSRFTAFVAVDESETGRVGRHPFRHLHAQQPDRCAADLLALASRIDD